MLPEITRVEVDWFHGYANSPRLKLFVDREMPPLDQWRYMRYPEGAEKNVMLISTNFYPWVKFVYIDDPSYDAIKGGALGGAYTLADGTVFKSRSGWSSRAGAINKKYRDAVMDEIMEPSLYVEGESTGWAGYAISTWWLQGWIRNNLDKWPEGVYFVRTVTSSGEPLWAPSIDPDEIRKPRL